MDRSSEDGLAEGSSAQRVRAGAALRSRLTGMDSGWILVLAVVVLIFALVRGKPTPYAVIFRFLSDGVVATLQLTGLSFGIILLVGMLGGLSRLSHNPLVHLLATLYVEVVRGIPLLVQLLFIWFALPQVLDAVGGAVQGVLAGLGQALIDLKLSPFAAAVTGLTFCYGAYMTEVFRAGIQSIHHGQMEAARSLGMSYMEAMRYIILPQALRVILPPMGNEFVTLLKDTSLVSILAVEDLTRRGREYMATTFLSFETWAMVALIYLVLTLTFTRLVTYMERRWSWEGKEETNG